MINIKTKICIASPHKHFFDLDIHITHTLHLPNNQGRFSKLNFQLNYYTYMYKLSY